MRLSTSSVAASPMGSTPQISPTSFPTFSGLLTPTPTRSNAGCGTISGITSFPTNPVPQTTTRLATRPSSQVRAPSGSAPKPLLPAPTTGVGALVVEDLVEGVLDLHQFRLVGH